MTDKICVEYNNEDTVVCLLFSSIQNIDVYSWETLCKNINKSIQTLSKDYIWHRDEFKVFLNVTQESKDIPPHLISTTCFGDNIEDEWFIVYLILEITKQFEQIVVKIKDNDGDFLLIEAANYLPSWANPENTDNRVFIHNGHIHLISPATCSDVNLIDSINLICDKSLKTEALEIEKAVLNRVGNYPDKIKENLHRAVVKLPLEIATLLALKPALIAPIVNSYCNHDMIDARGIKNIKFENCVTVQVKFTKCLYAMLIHSRPIKNIKFIGTEDKKSSLGLKLTCGFEIIMSKSSENIFSTKEYKRFLENLQQNGYFKENIEGSRNYNQLLENAKEFFMGMECPINSYTSNVMLQLKDTDEYNEMLHKLQNNCNEINDLVHDNENWLNIDPEQLNDLLNTRYGQSSDLKKGDVITPHRITSELSNFLNKNSDFDGIETNEIIENNSVEFDANEFVESLKNMMNFISSDENDIADMVSDSCEDDDGDSMLSDDNDDLDKELKEKFNTASFDGVHSQSILSNIMQSMKEEKGSSGPSSNILRTIGINKVDIIDSDDD